MDNPQVHKSNRERELIEGRGCSLVFVPSCSPDFDAIEEAFSKVKALPRNGAPCQRAVYAVSCANPLITSLFSC